VNCPVAAVACSCADTTPCASVTFPIGAVGTGAVNFIFVPSLLDVATVPGEVGVAAEFELVQAATSGKIAMRLRRALD